MVVVTFRWERCEGLNGDTVTACFGSTQKSTDRETTQEEDGEIKVKARSIKIPHEVKYSQNVVAAWLAGWLAGGCGEEGYDENCCIFTHRSATHHTNTLANHTHNHHSTSHGILTHIWRRIHRGQAASPTLDAFDCDTHSPDQQPRTVKQRLPLHASASQCHSPLTHSLHSSAHNLPHRSPCH